MERLSIKYLTNTKNEQLKVSYFMTFKQTKNSNHKNRKFVDITHKNANNNRFISWRQQKGT